MDVKFWMLLCLVTGVGICGYRVRGIKRGAAVVFSDSFPALQEVHIRVSCGAFELLWQVFAAFHSFTVFIVHHHHRYGGGD